MKTILPTGDEPQEGPDLFNSLINCLIIEMKLMFCSSQHFIMSKLETERKCCDVPRSASVSRLNWFLVCPVVTLKILPGSLSDGSIVFCPAGF